MIANDDLRAAAMAATPGPWWHAKSITYRSVATLHPAGRSSFKAPQLIPQEGAQGEADAAYIALASPDRILAALDRSDKMEAALERIATAMELGTYGVSRQDIAAVARAALGYASREAREHSDAT